MMIDELEVYLTPDGLGRAAIVRRSDRLLCIYVHWKWSEAVLKKLNLDARGRTSWYNDSTPPDLLYEDVKPEPGIFGTLDDARREVRSLRGFSDAVLRS
jgi:hypothetical protein